MWERFKVRSGLIWDAIVGLVAVAVANILEFFNVGGVLDTAIESVRAKTMEIIDEAAAGQERLAGLRTEADTLALNFSERLGAAGNQFAEGFGQVFSEIGEAIIESLTSLLDFGKEKIEEVREAIAGAIADVTGAGRAGGGTAEEGGVRQVEDEPQVSGFRRALEGVLEGLREGIEERRQSWAQTGKQLATTLQDNIVAGFRTGNWKDAAQAIINNIAESLLQRGVNTLLNAAINAIPFGGTSHAGGVVPGIPGQDVHMILQAGQHVDSQTDRARARMAARGQGGFSPTINVTGDFDRQARRAVFSELRDLSNRQRRYEQENAYAL